jgi:hypothetical protein
MNVNDQLEKEFYKYPAIVPPIKFIDSIPPLAPNEIAVNKKFSKANLTWTINNLTESPTDIASYFVVYKFDKKAKIDFDNPANIYSIVKNPSIDFKRHFFLFRKKTIIYITSLDRLYNESKPSKEIIVKL